MNADTITRDEEIAVLKEKISTLQNHIAELEEHLRRYTNGPHQTRYYESNKEDVKKRAADSIRKLKETDPERLKEMRHRYYMRRKQRLAEAATHESPNSA